MGGTIKTIAAVANPITYATTALMGNQAKNTINHPLDPVGNLKRSVGAVGSDFKGVGANLGFGGKDYTPQTLPQQDPKLALAQTGGAPLLAQIAMGVPVEDALAGYFGKASGDDFKQYYASLKPEEQSAIDSVKNQLTAVQNNTDLRNQAVSKLIDDYPNIAHQTYQNIVQGNSKVLASFDDADKAVMDKVSSQLAAKFASTGGFNSGAFNEGLAKNAYELAVPRAQLAADLTKGAEDFSANIDQNQWSMRSSEAEALRGFQQKMLGQGVTQGAADRQADLNRDTNVGEFNANTNNQKAAQDYASSNQLFGALGSLAGTALGYAVAGPVGGAAGSMVGRAATARSQPPTAGANGTTGLKVPGYGGY